MKAGDLVYSLEKGDDLGVVACDPYRLTGPHGSGEFIDVLFQQEGYHQAYPVRECRTDLEVMISYYQENPHLSSRRRELINESR